MIPVASIA
jgi:hypothetical protein